MLTKRTVFSREPLPIGNIRFSAGSEPDPRTTTCILLIREYQRRVN